MKTFGELIHMYRKEADLTLKELAALVLKEDRRPISVQYLNDLEHGRRNPPNAHLIQQFATALDVVPEALFYCVWELPLDLRVTDASLEKVLKAYAAFRSVMTNEDDAEDSPS